MKKLLIIVGFLLVVAAAWSQQPTEHRREFILEIGRGGFPYLTYGSAADSMLSNYASSNAADRGFTVEIGVRARYLLVSDPLITDMFGVTPFFNLVIK